IVIRGPPLPPSLSVLASLERHIGAPATPKDRRASEPAFEEGVGAVAVPAVAALEHVVLESLRNAERLVDRCQPRHLATRTRLGEDEVFGAGLDQQRPRRDERAQVDVLELAE